MQDYKYILGKHTDSRLIKTLDKSTDNTLAM